MRHLLILISAATLASCGAPTEQPSGSAQQAVAAPAPTTRFKPEQIDAAKSALLAEPKIKDLLHNADAFAVDWQIGVLTDGSSRIGYANYVCQVLADHGVVDDRTDVRIVDLLHLERSPGDFRGASLGHVDCSTGASLGT